MNNIASILLGLGAWLLPIICLILGRHRSLFCGGSFALCALSLAFQLREVARLTDQGDWSALMDTIHAVNLCAAVLLVTTLVLNTLTLLRKER